MTLVLSDLFRMLSYGELQNLSLAGEGNGTIAAAAQPRIVLYANDALMRLYTRFVLKEKDVLVEMHEHIMNYHLLPRFAVNYKPTGDEDNELIRYLLDLPREPFIGDVVRILTVYSDQGVLLPLNDDGHGLSVFTPQANILQVPKPSLYRALSVGYQARHTKLTGDLDQEIEIPDTLLSALTSYIAYKTFSQMNSQDSSNKAQEFMALYESLCVEALDRDSVNSSYSTTSHRFNSRGWI